MGKPVDLTGGLPRAIVSAKPAGRGTPNQRIEIAIHPGSLPKADHEKMIEDIAVYEVSNRKVLTHTKLAATTGAVPSDIAKPHDFAFVMRHLEAVHQLSGSGSLPIPRRGWLEDSKRILSSICFTRSKAGILDFFWSF
jgi:hypothetical protein